MQSHETLGTTIRTLRERAGLSQEALAKKLSKDLTQSHVSRYERDVQRPTEKQLARLVDAVAKTPTERKALGQQLHALAAALVAQRREQKEARQVERKTAAETNVIGSNVVRLREERQWTRVDLAREAQLHPNHLAQIETGKVVHPSAQTLTALAKALKVPSDVLLGRAQASKRSSVAVAAHVSRDTRPTEQDVDRGWTRLPGLFKASNLAELVTLLTATDPGAPRVAYSLVVEEQLGDVKLLGVYTRPEAA